jgi:hypothetical protein
MAVVAGVVFFAVRALPALIPGLTVSFPIKKWSAAAALSIDQYAEKRPGRSGLFPEPAPWERLEQEGDVP